MPSYTVDLTALVEGTQPRRHVRFDVLTMVSRASWACQTVSWRGYDDNGGGFSMGRDVVVTLTPRVMMLTWRPLTVEFMLSTAVLVQSLIKISDAAQTRMWQGSVPSS
jgi:hypothetical protein